MGIATTSEHGHAVTTSATARCSHHSHMDTPPPPPESCRPPCAWPVWPSSVWPSAWPSSSLSQRQKACGT
eukprot:scaffold80493_cov63-Phaeocystis_antarctica.AAC.1